MQNWIELGGKIAHNPETPPDEKKLIERWIWKLHRASEKR